MKEIFKAIRFFFALVWRYRKSFIIAGLLIASFFGLTLHMKACIVPAIFAGFAHVFFCRYFDKDASWIQFWAVVLGALPVFIFAILG